MGEAVLSLHQAGARRFELSNLRTASIRDQIVRGTALVNAMLRADLIKPDRHDRGLLVIGAGVAGCASALRASAKNVHVTLVDKLPMPLARQHLAANRRIDPVEYDWPQPHWDLGQFPIDQKHWTGPSALPMRFKAASAKQLAFGWQGLLMNWKRTQVRKLGYGPVTRLTATVSARDLQDVPPPSNTVVPTALNWQDPRGALRTFGAAVACTGFGIELTSLPDCSFKGVEFWRQDRLHELQAPRPDGSRRRVVVSGGGDGAMQDLQRAATGLFGRELFDKLTAKLKLQLEDRDLYLLSATEDDCRRMHAWLPCDPPGPVPGKAELLQRWHEAYLACVERVWRRVLQTSEPQARLQLLIPADVTWVLRSPWPSHCYGLNRFLALIVARLIEDRDPHRAWCTQWGAVCKTQADAVIHPNCELKQVQCRHAAGTGIDPCFDGPHAVQTGSGNSLPNGDYDLVIVRNGLQPTSTSFFGVPRLNEQLLPYDLI